MQQPTNDINVLDFQIKTLEKELQQIRLELRQCVNASVNEVQLASIRSTVERIQNDVKEARDHMTNLSTQITNQVSGLSTQMATQAKEQDQVQIRVLKWFAGIVITVLVALLIAYLTHHIG